MKNSITQLGMIVATDLKNGIGKNNRMPWHISEDLKRFKALTTGHAIIMGRKTWESLPKKPLPKRTNIVVTRNTSYKADGAIVISNIDNMANQLTDEFAFVIGGAEIYKHFYNQINKLYLTRVLDEFDCDTHLDFLDLNEWEATQTSEVLTDPKSGTEYQFIDLNRKP